jgi:hypothetical protein
MPSALDAGPKVPAGPIREALRLVDRLRKEIDEDQLTDWTELGEMTDADEVACYLDDLAEDLAWIKVGNDGKGVRELLQHVSGWLGMAVEEIEPDPRTHSTGRADDSTSARAFCTAMALKYARRCLRRVSDATEPWYRLEVVHYRRSRAAFKWAAPHRPDRARRLRSRCVRPRSSRGPPDDEGSEGDDGPPGTGRAR